MHFKRGKESINWMEYYKYSTTYSQSVIQMKLGVYQLESPSNSQRRSPEPSLRLHINCSLIF